jgi:phosphohistidine swiveling domain-containing protein
LSRREHRARAAIEDQTWREVVDTWFAVERGEFVDRCLALQRLLDETCGDAQRCAGLVVAAEELATDGITKHFALVGGHLGAGLFLDRHAPGEERERALSALAGASPGSSEAAELAAAVANALGDAVHRVQSVDDVRQHSLAAAQALRRYLDLFGSRSLDGTPDAPTLLEQPELLLGSIRAAHGHRRVGSAGLEGIPEHVRISYGVRDDNVGITCNWPPGLLRRAVADTGKALHEMGLLDEPEHAFHLSVAELAKACEQPSAGLNDLAIAAAAAHTVASGASPPVLLDGERVRSAKFELPTYIARVTSAMAAYSEPVPRAEEDDGLRGIGVGNGKLRGRARVARDAIAASECITPGDILVTGVTDSAFNVLLTMVDGLVTEHGGGMSHAALMARELGIPAIIGVPAALSRIPDGALLELDPAEGLIRIVDPHESTEPARTDV